MHANRGALAAADAAGQFRRCPAFMSRFHGNSFGSCQGQGRSDSQAGVFRGRLSTFKANGWRSPSVSVIEKSRAKPSARSALGPCDDQACDGVT